LVDYKLIEAEHEETETAKKRRMENAFGGFTPEIIGNATDSQLERWIRISKDELQRKEQQTAESPSKRARKR
jgi:hypothetical protein